MRHAKTATKSTNRLLWTQRLVIGEPIESNGVVTKLYEIPYSGTPSKTAIERSLRKYAPSTFFGLVYEPKVEKIDHAAEVVVVSLTHTDLRTKP